MAFLDVTTDVLFDPMLTSSFDIIRQVESIDTHGRTVITPTTIPAFGVITMASPAQLERLDDNQRQLRTICVVGKFQMNGAASGLQPDLIRWDSTDYLVLVCDPYPQFGPGFWMVLAGSQQKMDAAI